MIFLFIAIGNNIPQKDMLRHATIPLFTPSRKPLDAQPSWRSPRARSPRLSADSAPPSLDRTSRTESSARASSRQPAHSGSRSSGGGHASHRNVHRDLDACRVLRSREQARERRVAGVSRAAQCREQDRLRARCDMGTQMGVRTPRLPMPSLSANPRSARTVAIPSERSLTPDKKLPPCRERLDQRHEGRICAD